MVRGVVEPAPQGIPGLKDLIASFRTSFPDLNATVEEQVAGGDKVVSRLTMSGTHQGEFMGMPATGKSFTIPGVSIWEVRGGQLISEWVSWDAMGMMQQLGAMPAPAHSILRVVGARSPGVAIRPRRPKVIGFTRTSRCLIPFGLWGR